MKNYLLTIALAGSLAVSAQQIPFPQPSPMASFSQNFATSKIEVSYSRPSMKGRKIFGDVVPFGKLWRTGANGATTISFGEDVQINGAEVKAGKYGLLTIPGEANWTVIITKDLTVTSADSYKQENDVTRFAIASNKLGAMIQTFTIEVSNISNNEADIEIKWENTLVKFKVSSSFDTRISKQIEEEMNRDRRPYSQAANYYLENGKDLNKALDWINKAIASNPKAYWNVLTKAKIQTALKDYNGALATSAQSYELAKADGDDSYMKNNEKLQSDIKGMSDYKPAPIKKK